MIIRPAALPELTNVRADMRVSGDVHGAHDQVRRHGKSTLSRYGYLAAFRTPHRRATVRNDVGVLLRHAQAPHTRQTMEVDG